MNNSFEKQIEYKDSVELAIEYAKLNNKFLLYEYKDFYCQKSHYDNFAFVSCDDFNELCKIILNYMKPSTFGIHGLEIEIEYGFDDKEMEFRLNKSSYCVKIINCDQNSTISFSNKENIFMETIEQMHMDWIKSKNKKTT